MSLAALSTILAFPGGPKHYLQLVALHVLALHRRTHPMGAVLCKTKQLNDTLLRPHWQPKIEVSFDMEYQPALCHTSNCASVSLTQSALQTP